MIRVKTPPATRIPRGLRHVEEGFVAGNRILLLHDGEHAFPAMLAAIENARQQVLLEMYWFGSDRIGRRFCEALLRAAERGVEVALIYDSVGSIGADPAQFDELEAGGVHVAEFNPVAPWKRRFRLTRLTRRDHRKILVVDGEIGFTGGINIADQWLPEAEDGGNWRDDVVRVEGPAVVGFVECFLGTWTRIGGHELVRTPAAVTRTLTSEALHPRSDGQRVRVLGERLYRSRRAIARAYLSRIYRAESRVWIANSYFIPDRKVIRALTRAAQRGVDVRVLVPGESDVPVADWASRAVWARLMRRGVRIFEWTRGVLHSKTAVIDGRWSTIGTFNLDSLSLRVNLEVNVAVFDAGFGATMEAAFLRDLSESHEVDAHTFAYRSLGERLLEAIAYRLRKLL